TPGPTRCRHTGRCHLTTATISCAVEATNKSSNMKLNFTFMNLHRPREGQSGIAADEIRLAFCGRIHRKIRMPGHRDPRVLPPRAAAARDVRNRRGAGLSAVEHHGSAQDAGRPRLPEFRPQKTGLFPDAEGDLAG